MKSSASRVLAGIASQRPQALARFRRALSVAIPVLA